jgi:hypothetical protein
MPLHKTLRRCVDQRASGKQKKGEDAKQALSKPRHNGKKKWAEQVFTIPPKET